MKFKKFTAVVLIIAIAFTCPLFSMADDAATANEGYGYSITDDGEMAQTLVRQAANYILQKYKFDVTREELYTDTLMKLLNDHPELTEEAFKAMYSGLDEHSTYYTQEEYDYFLDSMSGQFFGIGVTITAINSGLLVTKVNRGSSAYDAGIKTNDLIVSANGTSIVGMPLEKARTYIVGEAGTFVTVGVIRDGEYMEFYTERRPVTIEPGSYQIVDGSVGYIYLQEFDGGAEELITHALDSFDAAGITDIIFDLRSNPGGSVNVFRNICQRIIPEGPVIHFEYKNPLKNVTLYSECKNPKYSLIVLANENSASAAEAFCGAVQDSGVGIVVGTKTYGKGTMQNLTDFKAGGGVKLTEAEYLTRAKRHINGIGITPDYLVNDSYTTLKKSGFNDLDFETVMQLGDKGETVLALNQRLWALGYDVGEVPTDEYTEKTYFAVLNFQNAVELYPYGVCDISTQLKLENELQEAEIFDNASFKTALEIFKTNTINDYKTDRAAQAAESTESK